MARKMRSTNSSPLPTAIPAMAPVESDLPLGLPMSPEAVVSAGSEVPVVADGPAVMKVESVGVNVTASV